jgi:hypothetical protein
MTPFDYPHRLAGGLTYGEELQRERVTVKSALRGGEGFASAAAVTLSLAAILLIGVLL